MFITVRNQDKISYNQEHTVNNGFQKYVLEYTSSSF